MIVSETKDEPEYVITGIAGKKNFCVIDLEKAEMNNEIGFLRRILTLFESEGINFEHIPSGIDTLSIILAEENVTSRQGLIERIYEVAKPDRIDVEYGLALIAVVGRGMKDTRGTAARICAALSHSKINIRAIDQGSSELNIIVGVHEDDFEDAIRVIYDMFMC
jgi:aspartate kinase